MAVQEHPLNPKMQSPDCRYRTDVGKCIARLCCRGRRGRDVWAQKAGIYFSIPGLTNAACVLRTRHQFKRYECLMHMDLAALASLSDWDPANAARNCNGGAIRFGEFLALLDHCGEGWLSRILILDRESHLQAQDFKDRRNRQQGWRAVVTFLWG